MIKIRVTPYFFLVIFILNSIFFINSISKESDPQQSQTSSQDNLSDHGEDESFWFIYILGILLLGLGYGRYKQRDISGE